ncbi:MAG: hypothetical protein COX19_07765 [Desulfobacterales bacterium CG23_combo_of_CG06-09_8_20_14_all_51_8]|nr:MAG: hypothetical protein COX19_07765 [Desulfobacterales bacterium CG23_combo_of_CG06-09_8_20_14_all_51_8]
MARLESQVKMGFYPTPVEVAEHIGKMLKIPDDARLLDTCCGEGEALSILVGQSAAETYGVELNRPRMTLAKTRLNHVLWADALYDCICSKEAFSLLWLNPPYDTGGFDADQNKERLEAVFLKRHWQYLQEGGVMVYIIPWSSLEYAASMLTKNCRNLTILKFPDDLFWDFNQIVLICVKGRPNKAEIERNQAILNSAMDAFIDGDLDQVPSTNMDTEIVYDVPASGDLEGFTFRSVRLDPEQALEKLKTSPVWEKANIQMFPSTLAKSIRPLTSLREGHLAMLLASGMMNGEVMGPDGRRLVVKGSVTKGVINSTEETDTATRYIRTDCYEITVRALCFAPVEIITIR